jgi:uncharacterized membrane protein YjjB (DUF3815 family)
MLIQIAASMIGVIAFAIWFGTPWRLCVRCGITGAIAWTVYWILYNGGVSIAVATVIAAMILTVVGRIFSAIKQVPATIFLVSGIFPLVPGAGLYYTAYYIMADNTAMASEKGIETFKIALAIAIGLSIGAAIPQKLFNKIGEKAAKIKVRLRIVKKQQ